MRKCDHLFTKWTEFILQNAHRKKSSGPEGVDGKFQGGKPPFLHKFFQKIEEKGAFLNSIYELRPTLTPESDTG